MIDWTKLNSNPKDASTEKKIHRYLQEIRIVKRMDYLEWLIKKVCDKKCLDVGAIEHNLEYTKLPRWKHKLIKENAKKLVGIDILEKYAKKLDKNGFDIRICDATSNEYLGEKFERVILGDVIEHVLNPVSLLKFAIRHLEDGGEVIVKTPNPYYINNIIKYIKDKPYVNLEHVMWITPTMMLEIARRADCYLNAYIVYLNKMTFLSKFINPDILSRSYIYILGK
jgi:2-polyprenyl-3-methyl-5-hydroxy-6-metoxy-1,4-benzoquinol methylase